MTTWAPIHQFPEHSVSDEGQVRNLVTKRILTVLVNQRGLSYVGLTRGHVQYNRSVAKLVAEAFLPPPQHESWDTPIHRNGIRTDNRVENLLWRPRWFAVKYHQQMSQTPWFVRVEVVETGETLTIGQIAMSYGVLPIDVFNCSVNYTYHSAWNTTVWPTGFHFRILDPPHIGTR
jgi:hypothetical protein